MPGVRRRGKPKVRDFCREPLIVGPLSHKLPVPFPYFKGFLWEQDGSSMGTGVPLLGVDRKFPEIKLSCDENSDLHLAADLIFWHTRSAILRSSQSANCCLARRIAAGAVHQWNLFFRRIPDFRGIHPAHPLFSNQLPLGKLCSKAFPVGHINGLRGLGIFYTAISAKRVRS